MELRTKSLPTGRSNAASAVGRRLSVTISDKRNAPSLDGIVVVYDPNSNTHTIKFDNGSTKSLILECTKFKWIVEASEAAESQGGRHARLHMAINRDVVGRKLRILQKGRGNWFQGTIVGFCDLSGKHKIKFESLKKESEYNLKNGNFRWTDLIGPRSSSAPHGLSSSRYMGVKRNGVQSWSALTSTHCRSYVGTFKSEKDAALSHDVYARKEGRPVNFETEKISEAEMKVRKATREERSAGIPVRGTSKFRGVCWQKNQKRWIARYSLAHKGEKNRNLGTFADAKHAALAFDAEARRRGRLDAHLNFPDLHPSDAEIEAWKMTMRVKDSGSDTNEVASIEVPTSSVKTKTLKTKRRASLTPKRTGDKRRKNESRNDTDRILQEESRVEKDDGSASLVKDGSARPKSSKRAGRGARVLAFPVGTRFRKEFPGHGTFQGTVVSFDGVHYKVYYPSDGDSEELSDHELDEVDIIEIPTSRARAQP
jgi:hypothetical protein